MADENDIETEDEAPAGDSGPLAGERLAAARREQQITVIEVAKALHLDERKVRALEQNEFEILGAPVFAKGHLRKYAQLVGVPIEDVLADYYALNRSSDMPPVVGSVRKPTRELTPGPWLAVIVAVILVAAAYWYYVVRDDVSAIPGNDTPATESIDAPTDFPDAGGVDPVGAAAANAGAAVESIPQTPATDVAGQIAADAVSSSRPAVTAEPPPPADGDVRLTLTFSGDCWTEITDAGGRQLFFDLGRDGRVANVTGRAPLAVLFGNAGNVTLRVNGEPYEISAAERRGQTARLTIRSQE